LILGGLVTAGVATAGEPGVALTVLAAPQDVHPGDRISVKVTVTNRSGSPLRDLAVDAEQAPDCARPDLGGLDTGGSVSYRCTVTAGGPGRSGASLTVTASSGGRQVQASAAVPYRSRDYGYYPTTPPTSFSSLGPPVVQPSPPSSGSPAATSPSGRLPVTGDRGSPTLTWLVAGGFLAGGAALLLVGNRRRRAVLERG
jgi:LPXTG-motif cell wall-anchored protein